MTPRIVNKTAELSQIKRASLESLLTGLGQLPTETFAPIASTIMNMGGSPLTNMAMTASHFLASFLPNALRNRTLPIAMGAINKTIAPAEEAGINLARKGSQKVTSGIQRAVNSAAGPMRRFRGR